MKTVQQGHCDNIYFREYFNNCFTYIQYQYRIQNLEIFLVEIILQVSADQTRTAVVVSQQSLASLREQEEDYEAGSQ